MSARGAPPLKETEDFPVLVSNIPAQIHQLKGGEAAVYVIGADEYMEETTLVSHTRSSTVLSSVVLHLPSSSFSLSFGGVSGGSGRRTLLAAVRRCLLLVCGVVVLIRLLLLCHLLLLVVLRPLLRVITLVVSG